MVDCALAMIESKFWVLDSRRASTGLVSLPITTPACCKAER